jgi:hypothetical protein
MRESTVAISTRRKGAAAGSCVLPRRMSFTTIIRVKAKLRLIAKLFLPLRMSTTWRGMRNRTNPIPKW